MKNSHPSKTVAIIQARMASSRLPGKVLLDIAGMPMLARVQARTSRSTTVDDVVVATTTDPSDDAVAAYCDAQGIAHTRGDQFDVLDRYYQAARQFSAGIVVRITADCPAIDAELIDEAVATLIGESRDSVSGAGGAQVSPTSAYDFVANRLPPPFHRTFPIGLDVEVCTFAALERAWREGQEPQHREHVMPYLYEGVQLSPISPRLSVGVSQRGFQIGLRNHAPDFGKYRWTVDTPADLDFIGEIYARFNGRDDFSWKDVLELVRLEPELMKINAGVQHKTLRDVDERAAKR
jgi:spore coat polysaccharide biosynthesis protein SpsF